MSGPFCTCECAQALHAPGGGECRACDCRLFIHKKALPAAEYQRRVRELKERLAAKKAVSA